MDGQQLLPVGEGELLDRVHDLDAGIGDEDIDRAERLDRARDAVIDLVFLGHVHADADGSLGAAELLGGRHGAILVEIGNHHAAARLDIALGDFMADAARGAGDEGNLAVELHAAPP